MRAIISGLAVLLILSGCSSGFPGYRPLTYSNFSEARVYISPGLCIHSPTLTKERKEIAVIPAAIAMKALSLMFEKFNTALKNGTAAGELPASTASLNFEPDPGRIPSCILIVRGEFANGETGSKTIPLNEFLIPPLTVDEIRTSESPGYVAAKQAGRLPESPSQGAADKIEEWNKMRNLWGKEIAIQEMVERYKTFQISESSGRMRSVDHIFEIQVVQSANGKYLSLAPVYARIDRSIDDDVRGRRSFAISVNFIGADEVTSGNNEIQHGALLPIRNLEIGKAAIFSSVSDQFVHFPHESQWFPVFNAVSSTVQTNKSVQASNEAGNKVGEKYSFEDMRQPVDQKQTVSAVTNYLQSRNKDSVAITLNTQVIEARPNKAGRAFFAEVFDGTKDVLETAVKAKLQTPEQEKAEAVQAIKESITTLGGRLEAENLAIQRVREYCATLIETNDSNVQHSDRISKINEANKASLSLAKVTSPIGQIIFGTLLDNDDSAQNANNLNVCKRLDNNQKW